MAQITRMQIADRRGARTRIELDGELWMELDTEVVLKAQLERGMELSPARQEDLQKADELVRARRAGARLLQTRLRSVGEIRRKLIEKGFSEDAAEGVVARFLDLGDLDDARFAAAFARNELKLHAAGPMRVRHKLRALGVAEDLIEQALAAEPGAAPEAQLAAARRFVEKRLPRLTGDRRTRQRKMLNALQRAGFESDVIWPLLREMQDEE